MSFTTLKIVQANGDVVNHRRYANSWGFAAYIWDKIVSKYLTVMPGQSWLNNTAVARQLWALADDEHVAPGHRLVLKTTFDRRLIVPAAIKPVAKAYRQFVRDMYNGAQLPRITHLDLIADDLEKLPEFCRGAAFYPMSVSEDLWVVRGPGSDDERPYNIDRDKGHVLIEI